MKYGLSEEQLAEIIAFIKGYPEVEEAILFGSRAIDTYKEASDIDIAIKGEKVTAGLAATIKFDLEEDTFLPFFFDVLAYPSLTNRALIEHIDNKGVRLFGGDVGGEWVEVSLSDIVSKLGDGLHGTPDYDDDGEYFFVNGNNLNNGKVLLKEGTKRTNKVEYEKYKKNLNNRTILLSINGTIGNVAYYNNEKCILGKSACYFNVLDEVDRTYVYYQICNKTFQSYINEYAHGTTIQNVSLKTIREYTFRLPPLPEQKAIANVLSSLDDKIDLLHRQNKTLEAMAETLFRQWFIEEAKEDWEDGCLGDIAMNIKDAVQTPKIKDEWLYVGLEHISRRNIALNQHGYGRDVSSNKFYFKQNDILFGKLRPYFHKVCFSPIEGICSTDILVLRPIKSELFAFSLFAFYQDDVVEFANLGSGGTRMPRTDWNILKSFPIVLPDKDTIIKFNDVIIPSLKKITENISQIQTLEKLRDNLLPKLMSGEVRVAYDQQDAA